MGGDAKRGTVWGDVTGSVGDGINDVVNNASPTVANVGGMIHHLGQMNRDFTTFNYKEASQEAKQTYESGAKAVGMGSEAPQPIDEPTAPTRPSATETSLTAERNDNLRRRGARTNLTGGMGITDSPRTASTTLLGN